MDSPVSSVVAYLLMEAFEEKALRTAAEVGIEPEFLEEIRGRRIFSDQERSCREILSPPKLTR